MPKKATDNPLHKILIALQNVFDSKPKALLVWNDITIIDLTL